MYLPAPSRGRDRGRPAIPPRGSRLVCRCQHLLVMREPFLCQHLVLQCQLLVEGCESWVLEGASQPIGLDVPTHNVDNQISLTAALLCADDFQRCVQIIVEWYGARFQLAVMGTVPG